MSEYNTNQDGQWKTSDQWRAEEANDHSNPKKNKNGGRGKYVAKLAASAVAFGLIAGLVMQGVTYGFSRAGIGNGATQLATTKTTSSRGTKTQNFDTNRTTNRSDRSQNPRLFIFVSTDRFLFLPKPKFYCTEESNRTVS